MEGHRTIGKLLVIGVGIMMLTLLACAQGSEGPSEENHPPSVIHLSIVGNQSVVGTGDTVTLQAETTDQDGDELSFSWSGDNGLNSSTTSTVVWNVGDEYGLRTITCTVSDGQAEDSRSIQIEVGQTLRFQNPEGVVGGEVLWSAGDRGPAFFVMRGEVSITDTLNLRVTAGTTVYCAVDSRLTVGGRLFLDGEDLDGGAVTFLALDEDSQSPSYWKGIVFNSNPDSLVQVRGSIIRNANKGLDAMGRVLDLDMVRFSYCGTGIAGSPEQLIADRLYIQECNRGTDLSATALTISDSSFNSCSEYGIYCVSGSSGSCQGSIFSESDPSVFLGGNSYVAFGQNSFLGEGIVFRIGTGYGAEPDSIDARNNFWGTGATGTGIFERIELIVGDSAPVVFEPFLENPPAL